MQRGGCSSRIDGFYQTYLSRVENGKAKPTLNAMEVIANALGLTIYELWSIIETLPRVGR